ncbi:MAG: diguanylate cyclase [Methyloprofundus sp.]|nr:diguanylate cyclase [Methyloprofundus sp.]
MPLKNLYRKLVLYTLSCAVFLAITVAILSFIVELDHSKEQSEVILSQILDAVENTAATAAYTHDTSIANDVIDGLLSNDIIYKVSIKSDKVLVAEKEKTVQLNNPQQFIRPLYSPFIKQQLIGQLIISLDRQASAINAQEYAAYSSALTSLLLTIATTLILLFLVRFNISQPLLKVSNTVHAIKAGDNSFIPILENHKDNELGRLINDINNLLHNQEQKFTQEQRLRKSIQHMEQQLRHIFDSSSAGLFLLDINGQLISYNQTLLKVLHCEDKPALTFSEEDFASLFINEVTEFQLMLSNAFQSEQLQSQDFSLRQEQQPAIWIHCLLSKVVDSSGEDRIEGVVFDVSRRVINEQAIKHKADHDSLTGLLLRQATRDRFDSCALDTPPKASIFLLDLDGFKQANDTYGHDVGDKVLIKTANRLSTCVRSDDLVCRLGGDEFLVILLNTDSDDIALSIAEKMINNIQFPMPINKELSVYVGVSIGIALTPQHGQTFDELVKSADEAMYEVKRQGKNGYGIRLDTNQINVKLY